MEEGKSTKSVIILVKCRTETRGVLHIRPNAILPSGNTESRPPNRASAAGDGGTRDGDVDGDDLNNKRTILLELRSYYEY